MTGGVKSYFLSGNTAVGRYLLYESVLRGLNRIVLLTGKPGTGKSYLIKRLAVEMRLQGREIEQFHCPSEPDALDGVVIPSLSVGVFDQHAMGQAAESIPETAERIRIDLDDFLIKHRLNEYSERLVQLEAAERHEYEEAYSLMAKALKIHDDWERYYTRSMDYEKANQVTDEMIGSILEDKTASKPSTVRHLFLGAATPIGPVDFIQNLTDGTKRRIFIKGRPGSGKSTMLKKIASAAEQRGFDVDIFHCGFDPNSVDMLIFREIGTAIFDSTPPHEHFPDRKGDEILDMYERTMTPGTDELYAEPLSKIQAEYSATMKAATARLANVRQIREQIHSIYRIARNDAEVDKIASRLIEELYA
jgi:hypothetical protein